MGIAAGLIRRAKAALNHAGPRRRVVVAAGIVGVLALVVTAVAFAWNPAPARPSVGAARPRLAGPADHAASAARPVPLASAPLVMAGAALPATVPDVLFVGASYTAGLGAQPTTGGYAYQTAALLGWRAEVDGEPGTGYLNTGPYGGSTYLDRIRILTPPATPSIVVLQSGRNDIGYPLVQLHDAVLATVNAAHNRWPRAQLIILGAIPADLPLGPGILGVEATLKQAAAETDTPFIDPIAQNWITTANERRYTGAVPQHPSNSGYAYLASRLAPQLQAGWDHPATKATAPAV